MKSRIITIFLGIIIVAIAIILLKSFLIPSDNTLPQSQDLIESGNSSSTKSIEAEAETLPLEIPSPTPQMLAESPLKISNTEVRAANEVLNATTGKVRGKVIGPEGEPVKDCMAIFLLRAPESTAIADFAARGRYRTTEPYAITDASGEFLATDLAPGTYIIAWRAPGYIYRAYDDPVDVKAGETTEGILQQLEKAGEITGEVIENLSGKPISGVEISASVTTANQHEGPLLTVHKKVSFFSSADGHFRLDNLLQGENYDLTATHPDYVEETKSGIEVGSGIPVKIVMSHGGSIEGRVVKESDHSPVENAEVLVFKESRVIKTVSSATDGIFIVRGLQSGSYNLSANAKGLFSELLEDVEVRLGANVEGIELILQPGLVVKGQVVKAGSVNPIEGATIQALTTGLKATSETDGTYRLEGLRPGKKITLRATADGYAKSDSSVQPVRGQETVCNFALEPGGDILVIVSDTEEKPIAEAMVMLMEGMKPRIDLSLKTDGEGKVLVEGVSRLSTPMVMAIKQGYGTAMPVRASFPPDATMAEVHIVLQSTGPGGFIAGKVTDSSGEPVAGAKIQWLAPMSQEISDTKSEEDGSYLLEAKGGGMMCQISASAEGYAPQTKMNVTPGTEEEPTTIDFKLDPAHWMELAIVDPDGNPVDGVMIQLLTAGFPPMPLAGHLGMQRTGEDGRCELQNLPGPRIQVMLRKTGWTPIQGKTLDVDQEHRLTMLPFGVLRGRVLQKSNDEPVTDFTVTLTSTGTGLMDIVAMMQGPRKESFSNSDGRFVIDGIDQGKEFQVTIDSTEYGSTTEKGIEAQPEEDTEETIFYLTGEDSLEGIVYDSKSRQPLAGIRVVHAHYNPSTMFDWTNLTDSNFALDDVQTAVTELDGHFTLTESEDDQKAILIAAEGYENLLLQPEDRVYGEGDLLEITLKKGGVIHGQYHDRGMPMAGASLMLISLPEGHSGGVIEQSVMNPSSLQSVGSMQTDAEGLYRFDKLPAGTYELVHQEMTNLTTVFRLGRVIDLASAEEKRVDLGDDLGPYLLNGKVVDGAGNPVISSLMISLRPEFRWEYCEFGAINNNAGQFTIDGLEEGWYRVSMIQINLSSDDSLINQVSDRVQILGDTDRVFIFEPGNRVSLTLKYPESTSEDEQKKWMSATLKPVQANPPESGELSQFGSTIVQNGRLTFRGRFRGEYSISLTSMLQTEKIDLPGTFQIDNLAGDQDLGSVLVPE